MTKTRWETTVNKDYLGAYSLDDGKGGYKIITVTIDRVVSELIQAGQKKEVKTVAYIKNNKPIILNRTNMKMLTSLFKSPYIEDWAGKQIGLKVENVKAFNVMVDALRICDKLPSLPELLPNTKKWNGTVKSLLAGNVTIEQVKVHFKLSKENETLLQNGGI